MGGGFEHELTRIEFAKIRANSRQTIFEPQLTVWLLRVFNILICVHPWSKAIPICIVYGLGRGTASADGL
jgi:hypothetical protein